MSIFGRRKLPELELGIPQLPAPLEAERFGELSPEQVEQLRRVVQHAQRTWPAHVPEIRVENGYLLEGARVVAKLETSDLDAVYRIVASARAVRWLLLVDDLLASEIDHRDEAQREAAVQAENVTRPRVDA